MRILVFVGVLMLPLMLSNSDSAEAYPAMASYYGNELSGNTMANGAAFVPEAMTVAHRFYPLGTRLLICRTGCTEVVVTDRGPHVPGRDLDVSIGVARKIGLLAAGVGRVEVTEV
jgi:rare lipoprotein A